MNEPLMHATIALAARIAERARDSRPPPGGVRAIAEELARERRLDGGDYDALLAAAESFAAPLENLLDEVNTSGARIGEYLLDGEVPARRTEVAYRATHRVLPRCARVAILNPAFVGVRLAEVQLMREACILEALHHSGVPRVFECGLLDRQPWIATEFIDGVSIERAASDRPLAISDALAVVRDAAAVLAHAHNRGVVHRNITPKVIIRTPGRGFPVCITEWGDASINDKAIPHVVDPSARFYRAPELVTDGHGDGRADVFALGAVMFEAATLVLPEPVQKFPEMPVAFHQLLASMLTRVPEDRPTAAAVHVEATRLAKVYTDAEGPVEEVEVELVDISRNPPPMPSQGWTPTTPMATPPTPLARPPTLSAIPPTPLVNLRNRR